MVISSLVLLHNEVLSEEEAQSLERFFAEHPEFEVVAEEPGKKVLLLELPSLKESEGACKALASLEYVMSLDLIYTNFEECSDLD